MGFHPQSSLNVNSCDRTNNVILKSTQYYVLVGIILHALGIRWVYSLNKGGLRHGAKENTTMSKSASSKRWSLRSDSSDLMATRRNGSGVLGSSWPEIATGISPVSGLPAYVMLPSKHAKAPKLGAHAYRNRHLNLAKPILRSRRAHHVK